MRVAGMSSMLQVSHSAALKKALDQNDNMSLAQFLESIGCDGEQDPDEYCQAFTQAAAEIFKEVEEIESWAAAATALVAPPGAK